MKITLKNVEINDYDLVEALQEFSEERCVDLILKIGEVGDGHFEDLLLSKLIDVILKTIDHNDEDTQDYTMALKNLKPIVDGQWI